MGGGLKAVLSLWAFLALLAIMIVGMAWNPAITVAIFIFSVISLVAYIVGDASD